MTNRKLNRLSRLIGTIERAHDTNASPYVMFRLIESFDTLWEETRGELHRLAKRQLAHKHAMKKQQGQA